MHCHRCQYSAAGGATFSYDPNGSLVSDGSNSYIYDVENRLVSASGAHNVALSYDPLGRLWQLASGGATTQFFYDGDRLVAEFDGAGTLLRRYVHGPGADEPLLWYEGATLGSNLRRLLADRQGTVTAVADFNGNPIAINTYDEWGIPGAANQGRFQYTGQAWLPELGMYYYKARIYSPTLGRFIQTDPIGYADQLNLYEYVGDDPVNRTDPTGMKCDPSQHGERTVYSCHIDGVAIVRDGRVVGTRAATVTENRAFRAFNARYSAAVNRLMRDPDRSARVQPVRGQEGSFVTTAGKAAEALISREFIYAGNNGAPDTLLATGGGIGVTGVDGSARTFVFDSGLAHAGEAGIVHDGGMHGTREEFTGGLQRPDNPLTHIDHYRQYQDAACRLLHGEGCD